MSKKITALFLTMAMVVCMAIPAFAGTTSWNTPTTAEGDSDKTSVCEVTANITYAYYVSMPAALTLEPGSGENEYVCDYQVKAKTAGTLPSGKNIKIAAPANVVLHDAVNPSDTTKDKTATITQTKSLFAETTTATTVAVDNTKWATIDGKVSVDIEDQGTYKGNFDFTYGLVAAP